MSDVEISPPSGGGGRLLSFCCRRSAFDDSNTGLAIGICVFGTDPFGFSSFGRDYRRIFKLRQNIVSRPCLFSASYCVNKDGGILSISIHFPGGWGALLFSLRITSLFWATIQGF